MDGGDTLSTPRTFRGPDRLSLVNVDPGVSARMSAAGRRDTKPEIALRRELHARGLRFRVDIPVLDDRRRRMDIVFGPSRVVVNVDGCFWHRCPDHGTRPKNNAEFWNAKLKANVARDRDTDRRLEEAGWLGIRVWEHEEPREAADRIEDAVRRRRR